MNRRVVSCLGVLGALGAAFLVGSASATDTVPPAAVKASNADLQAVWDHLRPLAEKRAHAEVVARIGSLSFKSSHLDAKVVKLRALDFKIKNAPGFTKEATNKLALSLPLKGSWSVAIEVDVKVHASLVGLATTTTIPVRIEVDQLSIGTVVDLDDKDPLRPQVKKVHPPRLDFSVSISSSKPVAKQVLDLLSPVADLAAHHVAASALAKLGPDLKQFKGFPGPVPAAGAKPLADSGTAVPLLEIVANVDAQIRRDEIPYGVLVEAKYDVGTQASWASDFGPNGTGVQGNVVGYEGTGDSAIWGGHYLAAQALRYHATQDPKALEAVKWALAGVGALLDINGGTGLLARCAAPEASSIGQDILGKDRPRRATIQGQPWVGRQGGDGISRDQYVGVFFGLGMVYDRVADPAVRAEAGRRIVQMADYLVAKKWIVDEDRIPLSQPGGSLPTIWGGGGISQELSILLLAQAVAPGRYDAEIQRVSAMTPGEWLGAWIDTFNIDGYFKFNLTHSHMETYFRHETDMKRWQDLARSWRIIRNYVGHHRNPHFDLIHATSFDPSTLPVFAGQSKEVLRQFVKRPHRDVAPAVVDLSKVVFQSFQMRSFDVVGGDAGVHTLRLPTEPLDADLREPAHTFLWQQDPFTPAEPNKGSPKSQCLGVDLVLPYWMGRDRGAF